MIFMSTLKQPAGVIGEYAPAQFRIGADGRADALGVTWISMDFSGEDTIEGQVWFDRIA